jgi:hypothetical protein
MASGIDRPPLQFQWNVLFCDNASSPRATVVQAGTRQGVVRRALQSAMAVFDVTSPFDVRFLEMIVTPGDMSPEGLAAYAFRGGFYLAIANEIVAPGAATTHTTLYRIEVDKH